MTIDRFEMDDSYTNRTDDGDWCLYSDVAPIIAELEERLKVFGEIPETGSLDCCAEFLKEHNCGCELVVINWLRRIAGHPTYGPGSDLRHCAKHEAQRADPVHQDGGE